MSKQISWLLVVIVAIGIIFFVFIRPSQINSPNGAAVITTEAERQAMIDKINADIANYQKLIDDLNVQIKDVQNTPTPIPPTLTPTTTVSPATSTLNKGKTLQLTASYKDETGTVVPKTFTWSTSSGTVATVSSRGVVTARNTGTATITATTGTVKGTASITVTVPDTTRPTVSITNPKAGTVSGTINVTASASDNVGVTKVEIYSKNGTTNTLVTTLTTPPYTVPIDTTKSTDGARTLTAKAYDAAGNSRTSYGLNITIKNVVTTAASCPTTIPSGSFLTCFYSGTAFNTFLNSRTDSTLNWNWGAASPTGVPADLFSMRSTGNFTFEAATYTFTHTGDDGTRLFIDNVKVDDQWTDHSATTYTIDKAMTAGTHKVTLEFYENGGDATVALSWAKKVTDAISCSTPPTETQTSACPTGQTGTVTKTRTTSPAPECTLSPWVTTDTCVDEVVKITPTDSYTPTVSLSVSSPSVALGGSVTLSWSSTNAASCTASSMPATSQWSGSKSASGSLQVVTPSTDIITYILTCAGKRDPNLWYDILSADYTTVNINGGVSTSITATVDMPNSPADFEPLSDNPFSCFSNCSGAWSYYNQASSSNIIATSSPTPKGDSKAAQLTFTSEVPGGSGPADIDFNPPQKQDLYVSTWLKMSTNYRGHNTGVNKVLHFYTHPGAGGGNIAIFIIRGSGSGTLVPAILMQGLGASYQGQGTEINFDSDPNVCTTVRGQWHKYEILLHDNTPGVADGYFKLWQDGKLCQDHSGITFVKAGQINKWDKVMWGPNWGGIYDAVSPDERFYEQMDHIYVSGK